MLKVKAWVEEDTWICEIGEAKRIKKVETTIKELLAL